MKYQIELLTTIDVQVEAEVLGSYSKATFNHSHGNYLPGSGPEFGKIKVYLNNGEKKLEITEFFSKQEIQSLTTDLETKYEESEDEAG